MKSQAMTRAELLQLPALIPLWPTAARALGIGRTHAYKLARTGEWPTRLIQVGQRYRVPTAELWAVLGIEPEPRRQP